MVTELCWCDLHLLVSRGKAFSTSLSAESLQVAQGIRMLDVKLGSLDRSLLTFLHKKNELKYVVKKEGTNQPTNQLQSVLHREFCT